MKVILFGEDVGLYEGSFKVSKGLYAAFGEQRVIDTPIAEAGIVDMAAVIESVCRARRAITVEESWLTGGWGGEIAARIMETCFDALDAPVLRVAAADVSAPYNKQLEQLAIPHAEDVAARVKELF